MCQLESNMKSDQIIRIDERKARTALLVNVDTVVQRDEDTGRPYRRIGGAPYAAFSGRYLVHVR